uniref:Uncharacterized protein n=2 Tax=Brassica oleracea TaxID=3712 RepID=A0A0D3BE27_BRAOL|nr:unnamed protein product [Brassica oleracea]
MAITSLQITFFQPDRHTLLNLSPSSPPISNQPRILNRIQKLNRDQRLRRIRVPSLNISDSYTKVRHGRKQS